MVSIPVGMLAGVTRSKWPGSFYQRAGAGFQFRVFWLALLLTLFFSLTLGGCRYPGDLLHEEVKPFAPVSPSLTHGFQIRRGAMRVI